VSCISDKLAKELNLAVLKCEKQLTFESINTNGKFLGRVEIKLNLGYYIYISNLLVIEKAKQNMLIGLDLIKLFKLSINKDFKIYQSIKIHGQIIQEEIISNYSNTKNLQVNTIQVNDESENKNQKIKEKLKTLISKYNQIFSQHKYDVGIIKTEKCLIELNNNIPINLRPYRCSLKDQEILNEQIQNLLNHGLIRKSTSPYAFPITLVNKKDEGEKTRLCIDFRKLNAVTVTDSYPFPRIEDIIDQLYNCEIFSILDLNSGFWQVRVHPKDTHKTAFVTQYDHYEWLVMPFGFRNSPATFQRIIYNLLQKHNLTPFTKNYLDDILIYSKNPTDHLKHLESVFKAFKDENVKLKLSKCQFLKEKVTYLGYDLEKNKITPLHDNTNSIKNFPRPNNVKNIQQFLGKVNFYHKFIPNAPKILAPLYQLLKKDQPFIWSENCELAFNQIKNLLTSQPVLSIFNPEKECFLYTDASKVGIGAVLKQKQADGELHPVGFFSKKLLDYQLNYSVTELECLAIIEAIEYWHHYLYGKKFTVVTDHQALKWLKNMKKPNSRLFNWSYRLSIYDFDIKYIPGKDNVEADCLSRNPFHSNTVKINLLNLEEIQTASENLKVKNTIRKNGILLKKKNGLNKIYIPKSLINKLIEKAHYQYGHLGARKLIDLISPYYTSENLHEHVSEVISRCVTCQENKITNKKKLGELSLLGPAEEPFQIVSLDTVGGFSGYNSKKQYLHLAIDNCTRYAWALCSKTQSVIDFINFIKFI